MSRVPGGVGGEVALEVMRAVVARDAASFESVRPVEVLAAAVLADISARRIAQEEYALVSLAFGELGLSPALLERY